MFFLHGELEILWIARYDYNTSLTLIPHNHNYTQLVYIIDGEGKVLIGNTSYQVNKSSILLIPKSINHNIETISKTMKTYSIKFHIIKQSIRDKIRIIPYVIPNVPKESSDHFIKIHTLGMEKPPYYEEKCQLILTNLLLDLLCSSENQKVEKKEHIGLPSLQSSHIETILTYLYNNYHTTITAHSIEENCHYSYRYISSFFKKEMGISPLGYLENLRVKKAKDLLRHSDYGIKKISSEVGFHSVHYFTYIFKKHCNSPPASWQRKEKKGIGKDIIIKNNFVNNMYIKGNSKNIQ